MLPLFAFSGLCSETVGRFGTCPSIRPEGAYYLEASCSGANGSTIIHFRFAAKMKRATKLVATSGWVKGRSCAYVARHKALGALLKVTWRTRGDHALKVRSPPLPRRSRWRNLRSLKAALPRMAGTDLPSHPPTGLPRLLPTTMVTGRLQVRDSTSSATIFRQRHGALPRRRSNLSVKWLSGPVELPSSTVILAA
jgi:hypothetical protein